MTLHSLILFSVIKHIILVCIAPILNPLCPAALAAVEKTWRRHTQRLTVLLHPARLTDILNYIIHCQLHYLPKVANYIGLNVVR